MSRAAENGRTRGRGVRGGAGDDSGVAVKKLAALEALKKSLLHQAFSGRL